MGSPALSPLMDRIQRLRQLGGQAVDTLSHPGQAIHNMLAPQQPSHEQAIEQMNKSLNDQRVQDANASHAAAQQLSTMKKPLGK